jgi:hypothetical protein
MGKESFVLYKSLRDPAQYLSNEDLGCLFRAILDYQIDGIDPDLTQKTQWVILYLVVKNQLILDQKKYDKIVERNIVNGSKGGRKREPNGTQKTQWVKNNPVGADNDNEKDTKVNNIEERKLKFADTLKPYVEKYGKSLITDFYKYWVEPNKSNTKFRAELEKTWDLSRRIETWAKNDKNFNSSSTTKTPAQRGLV